MTIRGDFRHFLLPCTQHDSLCHGTGWDSTLEVVFTMCLHFFLRDIPNPNCDVCLLPNKLECFEAILFGGGMVHHLDPRRMRLPPTKCEECLFQPFSESILQRCLLAAKPKLEVNGTHCRRLRGCRSRPSVVVSQEDDPEYLTSDNLGILYALLDIARKNSDQSWYINKVFQVLHCLPLASPLLRGILLAPLYPKLLPLF